MLETLLSWRWLVFPALLSCMLVFESLFQLSAKQATRGARWRVHFTLAFVNTVMNRFFFGAVLVSLAVWAQKQNIGLLHNLSLPTPLELLLAVLLQDFCMYLQHVAFHMLPGLWQLHRVHHSDLEMDTSTALRIHPLEMLLSLGFKACVILLLGPSVLAVMLYEIILSAAPLFYHANLALPIRLERFLAFFIMTPDLHRLHHSTQRKEANSNFGVMTPLWDRLCGSYQSRERALIRSMPLGLLPWRQTEELGFMACLLQPFQSEFKAELHIQRASDLPMEKRVPSARSTGSLQD